MLFQVSDNYFTNAPIILIAAQNQLWGASSQKLKELPIGEG